MGRLRKRLNTLAHVDLTGSVREIEQLTGIPKSSVARLLNDKTELQELRDIQRQELIQQWQRSALESIGESKKLKARTKGEAILNAAIASDKIIAIENPPNAQKQQINIGDNRQLVVNLHKSLKGLVRK
ncbi:MAG: hypothetical protein A2163_07970 [Actinobacteria bacterium RBG_13_35_12]|nr:MAG: hypothetical protein A2163_07970 [Actinobacteria bacterium RBG_13_35_12]